MVNGKGNARERWKTTIGLISQKANFARVANFFCTLFSLPLFRTTTIWNFHKLLSFVFFEGKVVRVLIHFFFTAAHFHLALVATRISPFVTTTTKFSCCYSNKKMSPFFFISRSRSLLLFFSFSFAGLPLTLSFFGAVFLLLFISNLWTWQLI